MSARYDPKGGYDVINQITGDKIGEVVNGVMYEGAPDFRQQVGAITVSDEGEGMTFIYNDAVFELMPQAKE